LLRTVTGAQPANLLAQLVTAVGKAEPAIPEPEEA
jgi:hypothetical protein